MGSTLPDLQGAPPPRMGRKPVRYTEVALLLRANPGKWALVSSDAGRSMVQHLRRTYGLRSVMRNTYRPDPDKTYIRGEVWASFSPQDAGDIKEVEDGQVH